MQSARLAGVGVHLVVRVCSHEDLLLGLHLLQSLHEHDVRNAQVFHLRGLRHARGHVATQASDRKTNNTK